MSIPFVVVTLAWLLGGTPLALDHIATPTYADEEGDSADEFTAFAQADTLTFRRIWKGNPFWFYGRPPSPDGRYLADVDWTTGDLALVDLHNVADSHDLYASPGWFRRLTDKGTWQASQSYAESPVFSPDGRRIAYSWYADEQEVDGYGLRTIGVDGADLRIVLPHSEENGKLMVQDWSRDGTQVLITLTDRDETRLMAASVLDGRMKVLGRRDSFGRAFFSPDGRFVAYDYRTHPGSPDRDIRVLAVDGSHEVEVVRGNGDDVVMGWSPDGENLLFHSNRELSRGIWRLRIRDGRAAGDPELIRSDVWQLLPYGFQGDRYYYGVVTKWPHVRTGTLDVENGQLIAPPTPVDNPSQAGSSHAVWSPDGRQIAYLKAQDPLMRRGDLAIRTLETAETRLVPFPFSVVQRLIWAPDTRTIAVFGTYERRNGIHRFDLGSGDVTTLKEYDDPTYPWSEVRSQFSPDGGTIYSIREDAARWKVVARDLTSGRETDLLRAPAGKQMTADRIAVSPDGGMLAVLEHEQAPEPKTGGNVRISLVPTVGGEPGVVYEDEISDFFSPSAFCWTPDGNYLLVVAFVGAGRSRLYRLPAGGGDLVEILDSVVGRGFELHPDGRRFTAPGLESEGEIWVIEGLADLD